MADVNQNQENNQNQEKKNKDDILLRKSAKLSLLIIGGFIGFAVGPAGVVGVLLWILVVKAGFGLIKSLWDSL